jgi:dTDP-4-amino-4,6-dideoxygalactose transaminase
MKVPILDLKAQYAAIKEELQPKVLEIFANGGFILGPEVDGLEKELAAYLGCRFGVGVSSGSDALIVSLMAMGLGEGDAVVTTPFTFFSTAGAISRLKARPVFCDIEETSFNLSAGRFQEILDANQKKGYPLKIKAVIPVHLYGQCADMNGILEASRRHGVAVIEDAAQAVGAEYPAVDGVKKACAMGNMGFLSFYPTKNLGGAGDGGMVLSNDEALADKIRALRTHGERQRYYYDFIGGNFRLDALQAAVLRVKLRHLEDWQKKRRENAALYNRKFGHSGLEDAGLITAPKALYEDTGITHYHTYHQYVIRARKRDQLMAFLKEREIGSSIFYPLPLHVQKCFAYLGYRQGDFPASEKAAEEVLALPIYPELSPEQVDWVVSSIADFYKQS